MKYAVIIVVILILAYLYMHSKSVAAIQSSASGAAAAGTSDPNAAPTTAITGAGIVGTGTADLYNSGGNASTVLGAGTNNITLPAGVDSTKPVTPLGMSSNGYQTYAGTGTNGKSVIIGIQGGKSVIVSSGPAADIVSGLVAIKPLPAVKGLAK